MQLHLKKCVKNIFLKFQISSDCLWIPDCTNMGTILYILLCYHHDTIIKTILYVMETSLTLFCSDQLQLLLWLLCLLMLLPFHASMHRFLIFLIPVFSFLLISRSVLKLLKSQALWKQCQTLAILINC